MRLDGLCELTQSPLAGAGGAVQCRQVQEKDMESESLGVKPPFPVSSIHADNGVEEPRNSQNVWVGSLPYRLLAYDLMSVTKLVPAQVFFFFYSFPLWFITGY